MTKYVFSALATLFFVALVTMSFVTTEDVQNSAEVTSFVTTLQLDANPPCDCPPDWILEPEHSFGKDWDVNGDGYICYKWVEGTGNDRDTWNHIVHMDNLPCPD